MATAANHRDALLYAAIAQRYLGRIPDALSTLATLEQQHPRFSRLYEERGLCFVVLKQAPQAIDAFLHAVNINHALPTSWRMLDGLYRMTGQADNAAMAASHVAMMQKIPTEVVTATSLFEDGDLDAAEPLIRAYLLQHGNQVEAMRLLARIGIARQVFDDAELLLAAVLELAPEYRIARQEYARVLIEEHKYGEARRELELLLTDAEDGKNPENRKDPENRVLRTLYATSCVGLGEHQRAIGLYQALLRGGAAGRGLASVDRACAEDSRPASAGDRLLPSGGGLPAGFRRCVLEPGEPQDLPVRGRGARRTCAPRKRRRRPRSSTGITCALRSARPSRIRVTMRSRSATTSAAMR